MSAESSTNVAEPTMEARKKPRVCHVVKREDFDGYGFNLHAEKGKPGQYIGKVDDNSPAEMAGLRQGDRIIEVNDVNIGTESHKQVVQRIKSNPTEVKLLVVDPEVIEVTKDNQIVTEESEINNSAPKEEKVEEKSEKKDEVDHQIKSQTPVVSPAEPTTPKQPTTPPATNNSSRSPETKKSTTNGSTPKAETNSVSSAGSTGSRDSGSGLNLQMTAAELRAKLAARKKFDPKSESVDIKKKFDIVQKL
ncbi:Na(+)/H(+) exchange regulatory cofactor NHE-RF1 [Sergentomyia squamirostris]